MSLGKRQASAAPGCPWAALGWLAGHNTFYGDYNGFSVLELLDFQRIYMNLLWAAQPQIFEGSAMKNSENRSCEIDIGVPLHEFPTIQNIINCQS